MVNVLIVENQKMARDNMVSKITNHKNYHLVGTLANAGSTELFCLSNPVDLILMDVCTDHDESGIVATKTIKKKFPHIKVIIVTSMPECSFLEKAKEANADSFWYKDSCEEELLEIMENTMKGESIYPNKTPEIRLGMSSNYAFTKSEINALRAIMESENYKVAAEKIGCSERTIRFHLNNILDKTGYPNKFTLCMAVAQKNLIITTLDD